VEVQIVRDRGRFLEARATSVLEPSVDRVVPACAHFGDCGGCSWQFLSYPAQLSAKKSILEESLRRLGKLPAWPEIQVASAESPWGGRNRAQFQPPSLIGAPWGFFAAGSRRTVGLSECPVLAPELQGIWNELSGLRADPLARRRERSAFAWGAQGRRWVRAPGDGPAAWAEVEILGRTLRFSVDGFFQSHLGLVPRMVEEVVGDAAGGLAWDLYSGVGLFASQLEDRFDAVHAVESDPSAALHAPGNLRRATHHPRSVEGWLQERIEDGGPAPDLVVVDPPRTGLSSRTLRALLEIRPQALRYVSCGHDTLARDLGLLSAGGYSIGRIVLVDLYPHTPHMEVVVSLSAGA
jgi:23S rRNA (uracil1939-C5)-methyltransferase